MLTTALCAAVLAACGGDDDSNPSTATDAGSAESTVDGGGSSGQAGGGDGDDKGSKKGSKSGGDADARDGAGTGGGDTGNGGSGNKAGTGAGIDFTGPPTKHKHPVPVEGERSDGFLVSGGDNSIQTFGEEQGAAERAEAMKPIIALYTALESGDWSAVCNTHLSAPNLKQLELLAGKSPQSNGKSCGQILGGLNQSAGRKGPDTPDGELISFRVEDDTGFAIWWGIDGKGYALPLKSEGGTWKLTALAPTPLQF